MKVYFLSLLLLLFNTSNSFMINKKLSKPKLSMNLNNNPSDFIKQFNPDKLGTSWSYSDLVNNIKEDHVSGISFVDGKDIAFAIDNLKDTAYQPNTIHPVKLLHFGYDNILSLADTHDVNVDSISFLNTNDILSNIGSGFINIFFFILALRFIGSLFTSNMNNMPNLPGSIIGNAGGKLVEEPMNVRFDDVAGCDEVKYELQEAVEFLKDPTRFANAGAKVPKGILLEGPPGTGKTLLAKAVAGEAGVPFISASGSEFIEMFVGVGASRVRNLFEKANKLSPCVIFIDEIDAIGRQRGAGIAGGNDEREQTLNQILTNMDGFESKDGVLVISATNRADILDSALTRPGRFDRKIQVPLPDIKGRKDIAKVHFKDKKIKSDVDLDELADLTSGFSGAEIANLANEAAIFSVRKNSTEITRENVLDAFEKITIGLPSRDQENDYSIVNLVSHHETGHALMASLFPEFFEVRKVTINSNKGGAGGFTLFTPKERYQKYATKKFMLANLIVALGGRAAEIYLYSNRKEESEIDEIIFNDISDLDITTGASNDLMQAKRIARNYITQFGFSENKGYSDNNMDTPFLGRELGTNSGMSEFSKKKVDDEINSLINFALRSSLTLIKKYDREFSSIVDMLIKERTINGYDIKKIIPKDKL